MINRGMIKWQPFSAVIPGDVMINEVLRKKNKLSMPTLSDDQINELEQRIVNAYTKQEIIQIKFYRNGRIYLKKGIIDKINNLDKKITLKDNYVVYFSQIIAIY